MTRVRKGSRWIAALGVAVSLWACSTRQPGDPLEPGFNLYSVEDDIELGRRAADEIASQVDIVDNSRLQSYVSTLGSVLADNSRAGPYPYSFTLINDPSINAFALPGGPVFINSGLLEAADNEAQLAGVIAHEISHVALRHGTSQASKSSLIQLPAVLAGTAVGTGSVAADLGQLGLGLGVNSVLLRYSRDAETEADALGARLMADAGYDPLEMASFFETLESEGGARPPEFLSSHPNPGNRMEAVRREVATFAPGKTYGASTGGFPAAQTEVARLPEPESPPAPEQTASLPEAPAGEMRELQHSEFRMAYPAEWTVYGGGQSPSLTIAPDQGLVRSRQGRISLGYGAVVGLGPSSGSLARDTESLIGELRTSDPSLHVVEPATTVEVDGGAGFLTELNASSPYGGNERDLLVTLRRPRGLFYVVFVAPEGSADHVSGTFETMYRSITF